MKVVRVSLTVLILASATFCSHLLDQYEPHDGTLPTEKHRYELEHPVDAHQHSGLRKNHINKLQATDKQTAVPELQVGHGLFESVEKNINKRRLHKRSLEEYKRKRRGYYEWPVSSIEAPASRSFTIWQPPVYQVNRPYFIPVWGSAGRLPIYFPPQPLYIRPYQPADGSFRESHLPPNGYLPPSPSSTEAPEEITTIVNLAGRVGEDDEDRPVWDVVPPGNFPQRTTTQRPFVPTRRPGLRTTTFPPLVHNATNRTRQNDNDIIQFENRETGQGFPPPPPPGLAPPPQRPPQRPQTTQRPSPQQPSRCVWAIISCCNVATRDVSYSCFEQLGCTGPFWDSNPCDSEFARAAIEVANKYYSGSK